MGGTQDLVIAGFIHEYSCTHITKCILLSITQTSKIKPISLLNQLIRLFNQCKILLILNKIVNITFNYSYPPIRVSDIFEIEEWLRMKSNHFFIACQQYEYLQS